MSTENFRAIGGNSIKIWRGRLNGKISDFFKKRSEKLIKEGKETIISNPSCKFINHCTILFNFTINTNEKYQLVHQGKFSDKFKSWKKLQEENENKHAQWLLDVERWEKEDVKKRGSAPIMPEFEKYPLSENEMFETIIYMKKGWYKKDEL